MSESTTKPPIGDVIRHYYSDAVVPDGYGWLKMCCPFHGERNASASVNQEAAYFKCFACDASGDSWAIIMKEEGCDFPGAVEFAERVLQFSHDDVRGGTKRKRRRSGLSDEARPVSGQRSILSARRSRDPLDGA